MLAGLFAGLIPPAYSANAAPELPTVNLSVEGNAEAANDLATATLFFEASDPNPAELAKRANLAMSNALSQAKAHADVKTRTGPVQTVPMYSRDGKTLGSWRIRSDLRLESRNLGALSELLGRLQNTLAVADVSLQPAPETHLAATATATRSALASFQERARLIAEALGKHYRIRHLDVGDQGLRPPPRPLARSPMLADAALAAVPLEAGSSNLAITVSGTIELVD
jgi:predicted secreted protein